MKPTDPLAELAQLRARVRELEEQNAHLQAKVACQAGLEAQLQAALLELAELSRFDRMKQGGCLPVDETPVKVMDPEVQGQCARGYRWF